MTQTTAHTDTMWEVKLMALTTSMALGMFVLHAIQLILGSGDRMIQPLTWRPPGSGDGEA